MQIRILNISAGEVKTLRKIGTKFKQNYRPKLFNLTSLLFAGCDPRARQKAGLPVPGYWGDLTVRQRRYQRGARPHQEWGGQRILSVRSAPSKLWSMQTL